MSTGDIKGNIAQLQRCLQHLKYPAAVDEIGLTLGDPLAALPILNFVLLKYTRHVAAYILSTGIQLQGKTDEGFVKNAFRLFRDHLGLKVIITPAQFLEQGFAERKVLLLIDVVKAVRGIHQAGVKQDRAKLENACRQSPAKIAQAHAARVQLYSGPPITEHLQKVPVTAATDAGQEIYKLIQPEEPDLTATAVTLLASPACSRSPQQHKLAGHVSPSAQGLSSSRCSQQQRPGSSGWQQGHVDYSMLQPRAVLPKPVSHRQQCQHQWAGPRSSSSRVGDHTILQHDQLVAASMLPMPREHSLPAAVSSGSMQEEQKQAGPQHQHQHPQQQRPVRTCLWPQQRQAEETGASISRSTGDPAHTDSSFAEKELPVSHQNNQQQQCEELTGTTMFMPAPQPHDGYDAIQALQAADREHVHELEQQLVESQAVVTELQQRLTTAEQQLQEQRHATAKFEESASARITLLEGRLKFLENLINSSQQQQRPATSGFQEIVERSKTSTAAVAAMRSSRAYMPASQFTERLSQPTSPATVHAIAAPRPSPARSAAAAVAGESLDWRAAASAAAAAVVAGLSASPLKSPIRSPLKRLNQGGLNYRPSTAERDSLSASQVWQNRAQALGLDGAAEQQQSNAATATETADHTAKARTAAFAADTLLRCSRDKLQGGSTAVQGRRSPCGTAGHQHAIGQLAADKENRDTGMLIDKLASRAVEAAAMLEAFRSGVMP